MKVRKSEFVISAVQASQFPSDGDAEFAFSGRSNVGKSSLINTLLNRKGLAKTSSTPGKTRQINYFRINEAFYFVDLPGYGYARAPKRERANWGRWVEPYLKNRDPLLGLIQLIDARHDPTENDLQMVTWLLSYELPFLIVLTKSDKLSVRKLSEQIQKTRRILSEWGDLPVVPFSAKRGVGKEAVWKWIEGRLGEW
ncbi:MAG: YihA family ribosome biogenesis GTP-binding protein [Candidatus Latescibacteria bacterium]|nr:YihA family ribosome biogenesis GTP-binding protein [Candidatus Latescibacterota bacterium]